MKQKIFNLIILDESGSMCGVTNQTINGCNETINTIKTAQEKFAETQEHFVSIYAFQRNEKVPSRYLIKNIPAAEARHITGNDYQPWGCTPLNDAVGNCLSDLKVTTKCDVNAIGSVTIITDGAENASTEYTVEKVAKMIEQLKELGWNFNFIGANIDVIRTASRYHIDNHLEFTQDEEGTQVMFEREMGSKMGYFERVHAHRMARPVGRDFTENEVREMNRAASRGYYGEEEKKPKNKKK